MKNAPRFLPANGAATGAIALLGPPGRCGNCNRIFPSPLSSCRLLTIPTMAPEIRFVFIASTPLVRIFAAGVELCGISVRADRMTGLRNEIVAAKTSACAGDDDVASGTQIRKTHRGHGCGDHVAKLIFQNGVRPLFGFGLGEHRLIYNLLRLWIADVQ